MVWEGGFQVFRSDRDGNLRRHPVLGVLSALLLGALLAALVTAFFPDRVLPTIGFAGASLVLSPLAGGWLMHRYSLWATARRRRTSFIATALGGASCSFAFAATRLAFLVIGAGAT